MQRHRSLLALLPLLVGAAALAITGWLWANEQHALQRLARADFDFSVRQTAGRIEQRLVSYEQVLRGVQGLYTAAGPIDGARFERYVLTLQAGADFSGIQWLAHVDWQPGHPARATVSAIAPGAGRARRVLGDDLWTEPVGQAALALARDSGSVGIATRLPSPTEAAQGRQPGFLMSLPLYAPGQPVDSVSARRAALVGWVLASVRMADLMSSLYGEDTPGTALRVHDGVEPSAATLMFRSEPASDETVPAGLQAQEYIGYAGHTWTLVVSALPAFTQHLGADSAQAIAFAGVGLALLLALLTRQWLSGRARAHALAFAMTGELRASEERYRRIVETTDEGIWLCDALARTTFVNPRLAQLLGVPADELLGRRLTEFFDAPGLTGSTLAPDGHTGGAGPGQQTRYELRLRRRDGGVRWVSVVSQPVGEPTGGGGMLAMVSDITARKQAESSRAQLEAQLRESQKMQAIGTLAGGIAHDFNNILAAIMGNLALARQQTGLNAATLGHLAQVDKAAVRARDLVQQILAFSRRQPLRLQDQALRPLVEDVLRLMRPLLPAGVALATELADESLTVAADATQLAQVVMNLCTNAWHALAGQTGHIRIGLASVILPAELAQPLGLQPGRHAHLWVSDTGVGMDAATRARVFEPFFTTKPVGQGTGLGLSVVHGILATHHGAITVESAPGQGCRFDVYLPQGDMLPGAVPPAVPVDKPGPSPGRHVLYVDDDPVMVLVATGLLQQAGYRVTAFENPLEALAALQARPDDVDLVVTDHNMPGLSGLDIARSLTALRPGLPVVVSSGYVSDALQADAAGAGVRQVMQKEYMHEQLVAIVNRLLAEPSGQGSAAGKPDPAPGLTTA